MTLKTRMQSFIFPALCALAFACGGSDDPDTISEQSELAQTPAKVHAATAQIDTLQPVFESVGTMVPIPEQTVVLSSQVPGQIAKLDVEEGQIVEANADVVRLDTRIAETELAKARATLDQARANLSRLERGPLREEVDAVREDARNADATADSAQSKMEALEPLYQKGEISNVQYEQAKSNLEGARALGAAAEAKRKLLEAGTRPETLAEARAQVAVAEAGVKAEELVVGLSQITSPIGGVVTELPVRKGMYVQPGTTLATIMDLTSLFVQFRIPADHLTDVHDGATVTVSPLSDPNQTYTGTVTRIGKSADPATGDVMGYAVIANHDLKLRPNIGCRVRVELPAIPDALLVPVAAVADRDGESVITVIRDNLAYETVVKVGVRTRDFAQILSGISAGDLVATEGGYGLPDACPVRLVEETVGPSR
ncbi:MAG: efflux RND transporter periplasmic adaptor subunit [Candidatus Hydrogenedentes bacterium]|nr:efflux RND transporter periplasmic adaptor subunit [Candidatus Hydrogenedentota bacterium]